MSGRARPIHFPGDDPQDRPPAAHCELCGQEVYHGENRFRWEGKWICPECFRDIIDRTDLSQLAGDLNVEVAAL